MYSIVKVQKPVQFDQSHLLFFIVAETSDERSRLLRSPLLLKRLRRWGYTKHAHGRALSLLLILTTIIFMDLLSGAAVTEAGR